MIRQLSIIAGAAFVLSLACTAGAVSIARHDLAANDWKWTIINDDNDFHISRGSKDVKVETAAVNLKFDAKDKLRIDMPHKVYYQQGPVASVMVSGPKDMVDRVRLENGVLYMLPGVESNKHVIHFKLNGDNIEANTDMDEFKVTIVAPSIKAFESVGSGDLVIKQYDQPTLDLAVLGSGDVRVTGASKAVALTVVGSGDTDLEGLVSDTSSVEIKGSGDVTIAPLVEAKIDIKGSGNVDLNSNPKSVSSTVTGSGTVNREGHDSEEG